MYFWDLSHSLGVTCALSLLFYTVQIYNFHFNIFEENLISKFSVKSKLFESQKAKYIALIETEEVVLLSFNRGLVLNLDDMIYLYFK